MRPNIHSNGTEFTYLRPVKRHGCDRLRILTLLESAQSRGADGRITARADRHPFLAPMQASDQMIAAGLSNEDSAVGFGV